MPTVSRRPIRRSLLLLFIGLLAVLLLLTVIPRWLWPEEDIKHFLARQTGEYLTTPVTFGGKASIRFWPRPTLRVSEVTIGPEPGFASTTDTIGQLAVANVSLRWLPLLRGRVVPQTVRLDTPTLNLERNPAGELNFDPRPQEAGRGEQELEFELRIRTGTINWHDQEKDQRVSITGLDLTTSDLQWRPAAGDRHPLSTLSLSLAMSAETINLDALTLSQVAFKVTGREGVFNLDDGQLTFLESRGTTTASADFSATPPSWAVDLAFADLQAAALPEEWLPGDVATGSAALAISLTGQGDAPDTLLPHLNGRIQLSSRNLRLKGVDLDRELADYQRTQRFSLVDATAFVLAGPVWLAVTKGSDFARLLGRANGTTEITHLVSDWEIEEGTAYARDVALATRRNRLAAQASLDLAGRRINEAAVAVINRGGCVVIRQDIHGTFDEPVVEEISTVAALLGAPLGLLRRGLDLLPIGEEECEVFYEGAVEAPPSQD